MTFFKAIIEMAVFINTQFVECHKMISTQHPDDMSQQLARTFAWQKSFEQRLCEEKKSQLEAQKA